MVSLRPSAFNQPLRDDGGPFLIIESAEPMDEGVDVYFTDSRKQGSPKARLLNVCPDRLTIWPLKVRPDPEAYLSPKYGSIQRIIVTRKEAYPYALPSTTEDVEALLDELPDGFAKDFRFGLGLLWEYRSICETIAGLGDVEILWLQEGDGAKLNAPFFLLGRQRFHALRRELNKITNRHQHDARKDKLFSTYQALLHAADSSRFPEKKKTFRPDALAEITYGGRDHVILSKKDQRVAVRLVQDSIEKLAGSEPKMLLALKSDIELVTLKQLIQRYQEMLGKGLSENKWQNFFKENPFILSLAFAVPMMLVQGQAYMGGKRLDGHGGKYTDFLYSSISTGNLAIVEIKTPKTELLCQKPYRGDDVYGPSSDLGGAVAQVLNQRVNLQIELPIMKNNMDWPDIHAFALRCILIVGTSPQEKRQKKSFELVRNALSEVTIVTFDELAIRLGEIYKALMPPTPELF
jgi:hypothetical protein